MEMKTGMPAEELLQAILSELQGFKAQTHEQLSQLQADVDAIKREMENTTWKIGVIEKGMGALKQEAQEIGWKINILYSWVDEMNLKAKRLGRDH